MGKRRRAREGALQILYQLEFEGSQSDRAIDLFWQKKRAPVETKEYSRWLVEGILEKKTEVDEAIQSISQHWRIERMALVDRNVLRLAAFELLNSPHTAPAVVINEAIEIAKKYSGPEAAVFVNGILDALRKKIQAGEKPGREVNNVRTGRADKKARTARQSKKKLTRTSPAKRRLPGCGRKASACFLIKRRRATPFLKSSEIFLLWPARIWGRGS